MEDKEWFAYMEKECSQKLLNSALEANEMSKSVSPSKAGKLKKIIEFVRKVNKD